MKLAWVGVIAAAILAVATVASAQKPDFSGTWTLDRASAPAAGEGGGSVLGNGSATVKQTADALTIERTTADGEVTLTTKQEVRGQVTEFTQVWTVEGSTLMVETTNARGTQTHVYKKSS